MTIVYCANRKIYHLLPTTLNSLLTHNEDKIKKIYLLIEDDKIEYINHPKIKFINCNNYDFLIKRNINCTKRFPYMAMVRCFLTKILKEDKVLYLDVDTVIMNDLSELWNTNLASNYIAARPESEYYINSGVLLMNLKAIRNSKKDDLLIHLIKTCRFVFPDQDAINIAFKNHILYLKDKFNKLGNSKQAYDEGEIAIRHFAGLIKPWKNNADERDKALWEKYYTKEINYEGEK